MVEKVVINDNKRSPIPYIGDLENFKNGTEYVFRPGVNIIVGRNGCGKTTLINLIREYLIVDYTECGKGNFNNNLIRLSPNFFKDDKEVLDGVDVFADYAKNTFRLCHFGEKRDDDILAGLDSFSEFARQTESSTGERVLVAIDSLFGRIFSNRARLTFDYEGLLGEIFPKYVEYIGKHRVTEHDEYTILMDEPDRNLSIDNIESIMGILSYHKPKTQLIAVIHNPIIICALSGNKDVNFIEMTEGYIDRMTSKVRSMVNGKDADHI